MTLGQRRSTRILASAFLVVMILSSYGFTFISFAQIPTPEDSSGPFVDHIILKLILREENQILALQRNEIDMIGSSLSVESYSTLESAENIALTKTLRNGYGYVTINTAKYPLNITAFRRAIALALDKEKISRDAFANMSEPLDSCIPKNNPMSCENNTSGDYYASEMATAEQLLLDAGFRDMDEDGVIEAPDGSDFCIELYIPDQLSDGLPDEVGLIFEEALSNLHVNYTRLTDSWTSNIHYRLSHHKDYDIAFQGGLASEFRDYDVVWMAREFWSENADVLYSNYANFQNATFDSLRGQLLNSSDQSDVLDVAREMQELIAYECPIIVCFQDYTITAHRTDKFEEHIIGFNQASTFWWSTQRVHLSEIENGPFGGNFTWAFPLDVDTFNPLFSISPFARRVFSLLYDSLVRLDSKGNDMLWLAETLTVETHAEDSNITEGMTRFTFDIVQNATWSDGAPLTAEDIAFAFNWYRNITYPPLGTFLDSGLETISSIQANETYSLQVLCEAEGYWLLHEFCYMPIMPRHILSSISQDDVYEWDPDPQEETLVTSGPFVLSDDVPGEIIILSRNPDYFYGFNVDSTDETIDTIDPLPLVLSGSISAVIIIGTVAVISKRSDVNRFLRK